MTRASTLFLIATLALGVGMAQAQDLGPAPGERVGTAVPPAGQMPELLQEVGLDQRLNAQVPLGLTFKDENGRAVTAGRLLREAPGDPDPELLRVPDAVHRSAERPGQCARRDELLDRQGVRRRHRELRSARHAGARATEEGGVPRTVQAPRLGIGMALPDRVRPRDCRADACGRVPLRLQREGGAVRPRERCDGGDAGRPAVALLLRHRVRPARSAPGAGRGVESQDWHCRGPGAAGVFSLRPVERPLQHGGDDCGARGRDWRWSG